jgi:hypothetical protein
MALRQAAALADWAEADPEAFPWTNELDRKLYEVWSL